MEKEKQKLANEQKKEKEKQEKESVNKGKKAMCEGSGYWQGFQLNKILSIVTAFRNPCMHVCVQQLIHALACVWKPVVHFTIHRLWHR